MEMWKKNIFYKTWKLKIIRIIETRYRLKYCIIGLFSSIKNAEHLNFNFKINAMYVMTFDIFRENVK